MHDHQKDYQTLGLEPDCSLQKLKAARRRLAKVWHPDRFPNGSDMKRQAEERFKEINTAFDRLIAYHQSGIFPAPAPTPAPEPATPQTSTPHVHPSTATPYASRRWVFLFLAVVLASVSAYRLLLPSPDPTPPPSAKLPVLQSPTPLLSSPSSGTPGPNDDYFTTGSTLGDVYSIQGVPTTIENDIWHYGKSRVYFSDGLVIGWEHDAADPLRAAPAPHATVQERRTFTLGSSKADVRAIQGAPLVETESLWNYGLSKVYFQNGRVSGWDSSPMMPLKARK